MTNTDTASAQGVNCAPLVASVDFETFYDTKDGYTLTNLTPYEYVHDTRFNAYLVAVAFSDDRPSFVGHPKDFDWSQLKGVTLLAHNATFDGMVLTRLEELGIVDASPREWLDTADLAAYLGVSRNLKTACRELLNMEVSKAVRTAMDGKTDLDLNEQELKDLLEYGAADAEECLLIFKKFQQCWPEIERKISTQNRNAAWRGINVDVDAVKKGIVTLGLIQTDAASKLPWVAKGEKAGSMPALSAAVRDLGLEPPPSFRKNDPRFLVWQEQHKDDCPFLQARIDYASVTPHIARLQNLNAHLHDGLYHSDIRYFGTHTGRTASGSRGEDSPAASKLNLLNLPKAPVFGVDMRGVFIPRPGHKFIIYDYGQIEARVVKWLAGDTDFVKMLQTEGNIYQAEAVKMGWASPGGPSLKHTDKNLYQLAKCCVLGLGYGMSAAKFIHSCKSMGLDLPPIPKEQWPEFGRRERFLLANQMNILDPYDPAFENDVGVFLRSHSVVSLWRRTNSKVTDLWSMLEKSLRTAALANKDVHYFQLPSGRLKPYFRPRVKVEASVFVDPETGEKKTNVRQAVTAAVIKDRPASFFHGGSLTENLVQATSRDIMAQCAVEIEDRFPQCKYMWSCYDEIIFEVPEDDCEEMNKLIPQVMCHGDYVSKWIDDNLPLEVEGGICDRYCK